MLLYDTRSCSSHSRSRPASMEICDFVLFAGSLACQVVFLTLVHGTMGYILACDSRTPGSLYSLGFSAFWPNESTGFRAFPSARPRFVPLLCLLHTTLDFLF